MKLISWIYKINELKSHEIIVWENEKVIIFGYWNLNKDFNIELLNNSILEFFGIYENSWYHKINFSQIWNDSKLRVSLLNLSKKNDIKLNISSVISADKCKSSTNILSICDSWKIEINSWVIIKSETNWWNWELNQENIFVWDKWIINWIPGLDIRTSKAKASHSLKIEKINPEELFYLESRGIDKQNATHIMLASKINNLFSWIPEEYNYFFEDKLDNFLTK